MCPPTNKGNGKLVTLFLGGIVRVWELSPRRVKVKTVYWCVLGALGPVLVVLGPILGALGMHWRSTETRAGSALGALGPVLGALGLPVHSTLGVNWSCTRSLEAHTGSLRACTGSTGSALGGLGPVLGVH